MKKHIHPYLTSSANSFNLVAQEPPAPHGRPRQFASVDAQRDTVALPFAPSSKLLKVGMKSASAALLLGFALFLSACSSESKSEAETESVATSRLESSIKVLESKPADALAVKSARETLKPGDAAVVFGQIGGVDKPFLEGYAGFVLGDTDIEFCDEMGDDHCPMPWDACCEDTDKLKISRASVQFVDAEGALLSQDMKGFAGIKELDQVVVIGVVAEASTPDNLIINATGIYVSN